VNLNDLYSSDTKANTVKRQHAAPYSYCFTTSSFSSGIAFMFRSTLPNGDIIRL